MAWHYVYTDGYPGWTTYGTEQSDNAQAIADRLANLGYVTKPAAVGIIANMTHESWLNPGQWELGSNMDPSRGFGLGQWTPSTKYTNWLGSVDPDTMSDGNSQMDFLIANTPNQWSTIYVDMNTGWSSYYNVHVPILATLNDYLRSNASYQDLTTAWMVYWERPNAGTAGLPSRLDHADYWNEHINFRSFPIWLICKAAQQWRMV